VFFVTFQDGLRLDCRNKILKNVSIYSKPGCYPPFVDVENYRAGLSFPPDVT